MVLIDSINDITIYHGRSELIAPTLKEKVHSIITDPPYELGFMGKKWDSSGIAFQVTFWEKMYDRLLPGGYLLAFGGTRTYHRMAVAIEDAGFEIRDSIHWTYGSGFPKNLNLSKAIDKHFGCERKVVSKGKAVKRMIPGSDQNQNGWKKDNGREFIPTVTKPSHELSQLWEGYGTGLKPSHEPIIVARKPFKGTLVNNVLEHGSGAVNIDSSRIDFTSEEDFESAKWGRGTDIIGGNYVGAKHSSGKTDIEADPKGRWPANTIHDGSEQVLAMFPNTKSGEPSGVRKSGNNVYGDLGLGQEITGYGDEGSAARFFKACEFDEEDYALQGTYFTPKEILPIIYHAKASPSDRGETNNHPTVKPKNLMRYLVRMFTPQNGIVLDPFAGSGTTLVAAVLEGFKAIGIELGEENDNIEIIKHRVKRAYNKELERQYTLFS